MKKFIIFLICFSGIIKAESQDYNFINSVITPYEKGNPIPIDTIYLKHNFMKLSDRFSNINEETLKLWWNLRSNNNIPPVELFLSNFNINKLKASINSLDKNSSINKNLLKDCFYISNEEFIKNNPKQRYIEISKPVYNYNKDWCFIVKSSFIPYSNTGGGGQMFIYVKIENKWVLYNIITLWLS